jgi:hypothetical protein
MIANGHELWMRYVDALPWTKGCLDQSGHDAFLRAASLGVEPSEALQEVAQRIIAAGDHPRAAKLHSQQRRAYAYAGSKSAEAGATLPAFRKAPKPTYCPDKLQRFAGRIERPVDVDYLEARSRFTCWNRRPTSMLQKLYRTGERVIVFDVYESQGCTVWEHPGETGDFSSLDWLRKGATGEGKGVWFMCQPVDGQFHWNPREQKNSRRSEESVTAWRYFLIESDKAPVELWLKAVVQLPLPVVAITSSGGESIHVLVLIDAGSKAEWDRIVTTELKPVLPVLGADDGAMSAVRLTRLGNCFRQQTKKWQRLLYLDPQPDGKPICQKEERQHAAR